MKTEQIKLLFAYIAYLAYVVSVFLKNEGQIELGRYEYVFVAVIAGSLKLSQHVEQIEKFVVDNSELDVIKERVNSILEISQSQGSSQPPVSLTREIFEPTYESPRSVQNYSQSTVIYLDELINKRRMQIDGYEIELMPTPK